jgi:hypothetical protein
MTNDFRAFAPVSPTAPAAPAAAVPAARNADAAAAVLLLDDVMARVGVDGLVAAFADPALLALLDQHAAAVRESLAHVGRRLDVDGLAAYVRSVTASARRMGGALPEPGEAPTTSEGWLRSEWHVLRLVAVCLIAEFAGLF